MLTKRYQRQTVLPEIGTLGQKKIQDVKIIVIGAGGLGCPALAYLASSGVGTIAIVDDDIIEESNLQRQILFTSQDIGSKKAEVAKMQLVAMNPDISIQAITKRLTSQNAENILSGYDVILDGTDNFATRYLINDTALKLGIPVVFGAITGWEGQVAIFGRVSKNTNKYDGENNSCYRCLYPTPPQSDIRSCAEAGAVGAVAGIVGSMMALEALKLLLPSHDNLKLLSDSLLIIDGRTLDIRKFPLNKNPDCDCECSN